MPIAEIAKTNAFAQRERNFQRTLEEQHTRNLQRAVRKYGIADRDFFSPDAADAVQDEAIKLLMEHNVPASITSDTQTGLFVLALANQRILDEDWTLHIQDALYVVTGGEMTPIVPKVSRKLSGAEDPSTKEPVSNFWDAINHFSKTRVNQELTEYLRNEAARFDEASMLHQVRQRLGVRQDTAKDFTLLAFRNTDRVVSDELGVTGFFSMRGDNASIYVVDNAKNMKSVVEHEVSHIESGMGLRAGFKGIAFRGLDEAQTENNTSEPSTYERVRALRSQLIAVNPELEGALHHAYLGVRAARDLLYRILVSEYKLTGFLHIAFLYPGKTQKFLGNIVKQVYIDEKRVWEVLAKENYHFRATKPIPEVIFGKPQTIVPMLREIPPQELQISARIGVNYDCATIEA